jgi:hypothetical protein
LLPKRRHKRYIYLNIANHLFAYSLLVIRGGMRSVSKNNGSAILIAPRTSARARAPLFETPPPKTLLDPLPLHRRRLWELHSNLHCSIIGTCFSNSELRQVLGRIGCLGRETSSDHDLHGQAVALAGNQNSGARVLHKALDRKYKGTIGKFNNAKSVESLQMLWREFLQRGEIPGAYWAILTHPTADEDLIQNAFGEVHMLSHLVGAANRADIRRLKQMELENAELQEKIARQQAQLRDSIVKRDDTIRDLKTQLAEAITRNYRSVEISPEVAPDASASIIDDLDRKLRREATSRARSEERLSAALSELSGEKRLRLQAEQLIADLKRELEVIERSWAGESAGAAPVEVLRGKTLLYVGGRSHQVCHMRRLTERRGAELLHHDGGVEETSDVLRSLAARADTVFFPVDCVSHGAVATIKGICGRMGKAYVPLRSSGLTSFIAALGEMA